VTLNIESAVVGTATAADDGTISTSLTVPAGVTSPIEVSALGGTSGRSASRSFSLAGNGSASPEPTASDGGPTPTAVEPSVPATPADILFYSVRLDPATGKDNADIYAVDPSTGIERRLTDDPAPDSYPARSPDGTRIVFDSRRVNGNRNIWVREADGSFTPLTDDATDDGYPAWSPDGSQVAWAAGSAGKREIWVMSALDGSGARRLTTGSDDLLPSWSSSGLVAFERRVGSSSEVWVVDPTGGGASARITIADGGGGDPAWSPDGRHIAFTRQVDGINRIFVANADGQTGILQLTPAATCDCEEPTWSPDGSQIAYMGPSADDPVVRPILVISFSGGSATRLTTNGLSPSWGG
jgi:TolB protein